MPPPTADPTRTPRIVRRAGMLMLMLLTGPPALVSGAILVLDPSGAALGLPLEVLAGAPFADFRLPGLVLCLVIGGGHCLGLLALWRGVPWLPGLLVVLGGLLLGWMGYQVFWIGFSHWLQATYFVIGLTELLMGGMARRSARLRAEGVVASDVRGRAP